MSLHIPVLEQITKANDQIAELNRRKLDDARVFALNFMASPGAGKTSLIERTLLHMRDRFTVSVIEGDTVMTTVDAERVADAGAHSVQVNTGGGCHLDAPMIGRALDELNLPGTDILIVENVGNLICPAGFALGTHGNVLIASIPEGDDKPFKYARMYRGVDALIINKIDLLPYVRFDMNRFEDGVRALNEGLQVFPLSCVTGEGVERWVEWIEREAAPYIQDPNR